MDKLWLIIKREYINKVRNKTFIVMTFVSPLIFVCVAFLIGFLTNLNTADARVIAVFNETRIDYTDQFIDEDNLSYISIDSPNLRTAKESSQAAAYYGLIHISDYNGELAGVTFYGDDTPSSGIISSIENKINTQTTTYNLRNEGLDPVKLKTLRSQVQLKLENYSGVKTSKQSNWIKIAIGGVAGYLLMMFIIIYGNMLMRSVIEEKTSRIIEVIISSVKPLQLMMGKITGTSLAGITQFIIWVIVGAILITVTGIVIGPDALQNPSNEMAMSQMQNPDFVTSILNDITQLPIKTLVVCFFLFFIGGYFLYASVYAAIGAAVDSETDTQQFMLPVILPLILAVYVGFFSVTDNPDGTIAVLFSYIPFTSPIVMLMRIPFGGIEWYDILLSLVILYTSIFGLVWLASKIYRVGILMYGKKTSWKQIYKWMLQS